MVVRLAATTPVFDDALDRILIAIELSKKSWDCGRANAVEFEAAAPRRPT